MRVEVLVSIYDDNNFPIYIEDEVIISYRNDSWFSYKDERAKVLEIHPEYMVLDGLGEAYYKNIEKLVQVKGED